MKWLTHLFSWFSRPRVDPTGTIHPHPKNAAGPFYVQYGCCTACDVPMSEAPDLFAYDETHHCFVTRQPTTKQETDRMFRAVLGGEMECLRYRGNDLQIMRRMAELGLPHLSDTAPPSEIQPVVRDLVTFDTDSPDHAGLCVLELAEMYRDWLLRSQSWRNGPDETFHLRFMPLAGDSRNSTLTYSWCESNQVAIEFRAVGKPDCRWVIHQYSAALTGGCGISLQIDDWLRSENHFCHIRWYTAEQWKRAGDWQDTPQ